DRFWLGGFVFKCIRLVDLLVVGGGALSEGAVASFAVVEDLDVVEDFGAQLGLRGPSAAVDQLFLQRREEALGDGVVEAVAFAAHRLGDAGGAGFLTEGEADELAALV